MGKKSEEPQLGAKLKPDTYEKLMVYLKRKGLTKSQFIQNAVAEALGDKTEDRDTAKLETELAEIKTALAELTALAKEPPAPKEVDSRVNADGLAELRPTLQELRATIAQNGAQSVRESTNAATRLEELTKKIAQLDSDVLTAQNLNRSDLENFLQAIMLNDPFMPEWLRELEPQQQKSEVYSFLTTVFGGRQ